MKTFKSFGSLIELFVFLLILSLFTVLAPQPARADGLVYGGVTDYRGFSVHEYVFTMDSGGASSEAATNAINGVVIAVDTDPGTTAPTDNYDLTIKNSLGIDILGGALTNRDTANSERAYPLYSDGSASHVVGAPVNSVLTFGCTAGSQLVEDATVTIYVYTTDEKKGNLSW